MDIVIRFFAVVGVVLSLWLGVGLVVVVWGITHAADEEWPGQYG